jgi:2-oxoglutarate dehydrogenase E1 component
MPEGTHKTGPSVNRTLQELKNSSHLYGSNAPVIEAWYEAWLEDPDSVPPLWAAEFARIQGTGGEPSTERGHLQVQEKFRSLGRFAPTPGPDYRESDHKQAAVLRLIHAYRIRGHETARLDPLGKPHRDPVADLELEFNDLGPADLDSYFDTGTLVAPERLKLRDIVELCERVYCGSIGIEYMHIIDTTKREWLQKRLEGSAGIYDVVDSERLRILQMLTATEGLEKYLHTRYVGQKRFSLEGGDSLGQYSWQVSSDVVCGIRRKTGQAGSAALWRRQVSPRFCI